jgi:hypothetical protein
LVLGLRGDPKFQQKLPAQAAVTAARFRDVVEEYDVDTLRRFPPVKRRYKMRAHLRV